MVRVVNGVLVNDDTPADAEPSSTPGLWVPAEDGHWYNHSIRVIGRPIRVIILAIILLLLGLFFGVRGLIVALILAILVVLANRCGLGASPPSQEGPSATSGIPGHAAGRSSSRPTSSMSTSSKGSGRGSGRGGPQIYGFSDVCKGAPEGG